MFFKNKQNPWVRRWLSGKEHPDLIPSAHVVAHTISKLRSQGIQYPLLDSVDNRHIHGTHNMHAGKTHTHKIKFKFKNKLFASPWVLLMFLHPGYPITMFPQLLARKFKPQRATFPQKKLCYMVFWPFACSRRNLWIGGMLELFVSLGK